MTRDTESYPTTNQSDAPESIHSVVEKFLPSEHAKILGKSTIELMNRELEDDYYKEKHASIEEAAQNLADQTRAELEEFNSPLDDDEFSNGEREFQTTMKHNRLMQNVIFTYFAREGKHGDSIIDLIHPETAIFPKNEQTQHDNHIEEYLKPRAYLDFISALTKKDKYDRYVVSNHDLNIFTNWYHGEVKHLETEVEKHASDFERYYTNALGFAIDQKFLPESFQSCLDYFNPDSPTSRSIKYTLMDRTKRAENGASPSGFTNLDEDNGSFIIGLGIDRIYSYSTHKGDEVKDGFRVVNHELTHVISDMNSFNFYDEHGKTYNEKAKKILVESITEDIGGIISAVAETKDKDNPLAMQNLPKIEPIGGNGQSYALNRKTLQFLQRSGAHEIDQNLFYEAYVDSSKWPVLNKELKTAFPECKTDRTLADFIVTKRNELKK